MVAEARFHVMVVVDIERFGRRSDDLQKVLRNRLYEVMETALETVGVHRQDVRDPEDRGDALLWVLPGWVSMVALTGRFTARLHSELLGYPSGGEDEMRLRAALHAGMVAADRNTWVGQDLNTAFRLVDAEPLRAALARTSAPYVLMMSQQMARADRGPGDRGIRLVGVPSGSHRRQGTGGRQRLALHAWLPSGDPAFRSAGRPRARARGAADRAGRCGKPGPREA